MNMEKKIHQTTEQQQREELQHNTESHFIITKTTTLHLIEFYMFTEDKLRMKTWKRSNKMI